MKLLKEFQKMMKNYVWTMAISITLDMKRGKNTLFTVEKRNA